MSMPAFIRGTLSNLTLSNTFLVKYICYYVIKPNLLFNIILYSVVSPIRTMVIQINFFFVPMKHIFYSITHCSGNIGTPCLIFFL